MKLKKLLGLVLSGVLIISSVGCSSSKEQSKDDKKIVVGCNLVPGEELLKAVKPLIEAEGYKLEVKVFNDYVLPNTALNDGELDANLFQHKPFLEKTNEEKGYDLVAVEPLYVCPITLYSDKRDSLEDLQDGDTIALTNDPSNESRSLRLLESAGLIKIKEGELVTPNDIIENPKNLKFVEAEASLLPSILKDVEAAFINTNFAVAAGINANEQGILIAPTDNTYANIIASRKGDEESEKIQVLKKALTSDEARDFINNEYKGTIIPIF